MSPTVKHTALGVSLGVVISLLPLPLNLPAFAIVFVIGVVAVFRRRESLLWQRRFVVCLLAVSVVTIAILLPVKHLDLKVGPMNYERMPLDALTQSLRQDWRVPVRVFDPQSKGRIISFRTEQALTRREVLEKLARESAMELHIGYCGTGATFLFGSHPSFTTLSPKSEQPVVGK